MPPVTGLLLIIAVAISICPPSECVKVVRHLHICTTTNTFVEKIEYFGLELWDYILYAVYMVPVSDH